jgi:hypothetical protein
MVEHEYRRIRRRQTMTSPQVIAFFFLLLAAAPAHAELSYKPVDFSKLKNQNRDLLINGNSYPTGPQVFAGVPFQLSDKGAYMWYAQEGPNPRVAEIPVSVFGVREVHTLINSYNGAEGPRSLASIEFVGTQDAHHKVELIGNDDIRDHHENDRYTNKIDGKTTIEVFNSGHGQRLDKQRFVLPDEFHDQTLISVRLTDTGARGIQRIFLAGLTVASESQVSKTTDANVEQFVRRQEKAAVAADNRLLAAIDKRTKEIRRSKIDSATMQLQLDTIQQQRDEFVKGGNLPVSDQLVDIVIEYLKETQRILKNCEQFRAKAGRTKRGNGPDLEKLRQLQEELKAVVGGRNTFLANTKWDGTRREPDGAGTRMRLEVNQISGDAFRGVIIQFHGGGSPERHSIVGELNGNELAFDITGAIDGGKRAMHCEGWLIGDRLVSNVAWINPAGQRKLGPMILKRIP